MPEGSKILLFSAGFLAFAGVLWWLWIYFQLPTIPFGRLPGDINIQGKAGSFYFPITTCILLSALLSLGIWVLKKFFSLF